jgi:hypothetical protein
MRFMRPELSAAKCRSPNESRISAAKYICRAAESRIVVWRAMKKILTIAVLAASTLAYTSCTVVEPVPATSTTTTTHETTTVARPTTTETTTTRMGGGY